MSSTGHWLGFLSVYSDFLSHSKPIVNDLTFNIHAIGCRTQMDPESEWSEMASIADIIVDISGYHSGNTWVV